MGIGPLRVVLLFGKTHERIKMDFTKKIIPNYNNNLYVAIPVYEKGTVNNVFLRQIVAWEVNVKGESRFAKPITTDLEQPKPVVFDSTHGEWHGACGGYGQGKEALINFFNSSEYGSSKNGD